MSAEICNPHSLVSTYCCLHGLHSTSRPRFPSSTTSSAESRVKVRAQLEAQQTLPLPTNMLPLELLHKIFTECRDDWPDASQCRAPWMSITQVCQGWRSVTLNDPLLWCNREFAKSGRKRAARFRIMRGSGCASSCVGNHRHFFRIAAGLYVNVCDRSD